jgi:hypothetical protein
MNSRRTAAAGVAIAALGLGGSAAYAAIPSQGVITGCYTKSSGELRLIDVAKTTTCKSGEAKLTWSQTGPAGPAGSAGARGLTGAAGPAGPAGPAGSAGLTGAAGARGPAGLDGADGAPGPAGRDGADGAPGPAGRDGADGAPGPTGPTGPTGPSSNVVLGGFAGAISIDGPGATVAVLFNVPAGSHLVTGKTSISNLAPTVEPAQCTVGPVERSRVVLAPRFQGGSEQVVVLHGAITLTAPANIVMHCSSSVADAVQTTLTATQFGG